MNSYHAIRAHEGGWAVVWVSSDVVLGFVSKRFDTEGEALLAAYEKSRDELEQALSLLADAINMLHQSFSKGPSFKPW